MSEPIYRAPMRARDLELPDGAGATFGLEHGVVGIGDALSRVPDDLDDAVSLADAEHGAKAARMLERFADLSDGTLVWTQEAPGVFRLGRLTGAWRYDDSPGARAVGIHHVRPTDWLGESLTEPDVPPAVVATFARGGRNLQRTHNAEAERRTAALWAGRSN